MKIMHERDKPLEVKGTQFCGCCGSMFIPHKDYLDDYNQGVMLLQTNDTVELGEFDTYIVEKLPIPGANIYLKLRTSNQYADNE